MKIDFITHPERTAIDFLTTKINKEIEGFGNTSPFAFFIRNDKEEIIARNNCFIVFGSIHTDQLWVSRLGTKPAGLRP